MGSEASALRELDAAALAKRLAETRQELFNLRFQLATSKISNYNTLRVVRRQVARILTVMGEANRGA